MKKYIIAITVSLASLSLCAQEGMWEFMPTYDIGIPSGNLADFIDNEASFRGFSFDFNYFMTDQVTLGGYVGWSIFHKVFDRETIEFPGGSINVKQWRYAHSVPIVLNAHYHFFTEDKVSLFAGGGMGLYYINQEVWAGLVEIKDDSWRFGLVPEVGAKVKFGENNGLRVSGQYNWVVNGYLDGVDHLSYWNIKMGIYFKY